MYTIEDNVRLYVADSSSELEQIECPDFAVSIAACAPTTEKVYYAQQEYDHEPTQEDVEQAYLKIGPALAKELRNQGVYTKELLLTASHPEVSLPKELTEEFGKDTQAFKACSLLWFWLVSEQ